MGIVSLCSHSRAGHNPYSNGCTGMIIDWEILKSLLGVIFPSTYCRVMYVNLAVVGTDLLGNQWLLWL